MHGQGMAPPFSHLYQESRLQDKVYANLTNIRNLAVIFYTPKWWAYSNCLVNLSVRPSTHPSPWKSTGLSLRNMLSLLMIVQNVFVYRFMPHVHSLFKMFDLAHLNYVFFTLSFVIDNH